MKNTIWISFLLLVALLALWFIVKSTLAVCSYFNYSLEVPVTVEKWSVEEVHSDQFAIQAHYNYFLQGKEYLGVGTLGSRYPNPWAANQAQKHFAQQNVTAWVNPKQPEKSLLEKKFPYKKAISAAMLVILFIYFAILGTYVRLKHGR